MQAALNTLKRRSCVSFLLTGMFKREHEALVRKLNDSFRETLVAGHLPYEEVLKLYSESYAVLVPLS
jgi:hypothetical protein